MESSLSKEERMKKRDKFKQGAEEEEKKEEEEEEGQEQGRRGVSSE